MKFFFTILAAILLVIQIKAQQNKIISGIIKDLQNMPLANATIFLYNAKDSALIQKKIAKDNGRFDFSNLKNGEFLLSVSFTGYKKYTSVTLFLTDQHSNIVLRHLY